MEGARSIPGQEQGPASKPAGGRRLRSALLKTFILGSDLCRALLMLMQGTTSQVPPKEQLHRRSELERQCIQTKPGGRQPGKAGQGRAFRDPVSAAGLAGV